MEDHHNPHHLFFGVSESPSMDDLFGAAKSPSRLTDLPAADDTSTGQQQQQLDSVSTFDFPEDYNSLWLSICDDRQGGTEAGPSGTHGDHDHQEIGNDFHAPENMEAPVSENNDCDDDCYDENMIRPLQVWPASPMPFNCSFCQVLREIIHVHYELNSYMKLEIHGRLGVICHAILERKIANGVSGTSGDSQFEMLDFCSRSTEEVKYFLTWYCLQRSEEGYTMSNDPLSIFYEALCVGLSSHKILHDDDFVTSPSLSSNPGGESDYQNVEQPEHQPHQKQQEQVEDQRETRRRTKKDPRIPLAAQRKRTARLTLMDLRGVFHLALVDASKRMDVCSTVLKKICRRDGVNRWPYRKLVSVKKKIAELQQTLNSSDAESRAEAEEKIDALRQEAMNACGGISIL